VNAVPPADVPFGHEANGHDANGQDEAAVPYGHNLPGRDEVQLPVTTGRGTRPPHYLVSMDLVDVPCLVVGGGPVAARKIEGLVEAGAVITVVAPTVVAEIRDHPRVRWHEREYRRGEVASYRLAITATGVPAVDGQVAHDARAAGVPVNSADDPANCTFTLPAIARNGDIQVAVATAGRSPALASWLRSRIEAALDDSLLDLLDLLASTRGEMRDAGLPTELPGWRRALEGDLPALVADGRLDEARALLRRELDLHRSSDPALEGVSR
jgi:precorrin-2 dehydrogenase / sirohydrochlorin ferrochelatase